jgi:hypothetical protein
VSKLPWVTRRLAILTILLLSLAACGGGGNGAGAPGNTSDVSAPTQAPDFTLELGDGGSYTLSERDKPVYLVFWAEW